MGGAARRPARARARGRRRGAALRADHAVHRADHRSPRSSTAGSRSRPARSCSSPPGTPTATVIEPDAFDITAAATARAGADVRRRHPLLRRREPGPRRDAGGTRVPRRARQLDRARRRARVRHPVGDLRARVAAAAAASRPAAAYAAALPQRVVAERLRVSPCPSATSSISAASARGPVGRVVAARQQRRDLLRRQPARGSARAAAPGVSGGGSALERRVEVGDQHVVGLDRLKAAGDEPRSRWTANTTDGAVKRTGPSVVAVLPWSSAGEPAALAGLGPVALVGLGHLGRVEPSTMTASASMPGHARAARRAAARRRRAAAAS